MLSYCLAVGIMAINVSNVPLKVAQLQVPLLRNLQNQSQLGSESENRVTSAWIFLDGRRLFQIAAPRATISERQEQIQENLQLLSQNYFKSPTNEVKVQLQTLNDLPVIYVNNQYLMTITPQDANLRQVEPTTAANQIIVALQQSLKRAKQERQTSSLINQSQIGVATGFTVIFLSGAIFYLQRRYQRQRLPAANTTKTDTIITTQLKQRQQEYFRDIKQRLFPLAQVAIWGSGIIFILGLFPYTRVVQVTIINAVQIPLRLGLVIIITYFLIRLTYILIDRFTTALVKSSPLFPETDIAERLQLRVSTISGVAKSIAVITWVGVGILLGLLSLSIDIVPLLAGLSVVGVAVSLASQNIIKDAINGFLIILEDQYALGDVISVGNVQGLVENLNLRITQLRDTEGRLITIPNSEVKIVANLSNRWSRADLRIPVAYQADVNKALELIQEVANNMDKDPEWQQPILETPRVLGVDNFGERGLIIRVWIKTQPLKQWDVAREFRRRLKIAFDEAGISIPLPQQVVWLSRVESDDAKE